ncbi:endonuclease/exonuclease/phosphatase family protein [Flavihumibacter sp. UBA7668]|uniref:endonuclease/exonuclease/phosphatase family protein n=1 Tax=Flavihumibacter sp. UBA7668 TaxID=1946542 RepID=UPI0025BF5457|nr:endonuclease/exonuclease/phosphatase family protein [Flavihumibacter sp. UBA7668]
MKKNNWIFLAGLVFLFACATTGKKGTDSGKQLIVLSYNIHHGNPPTREAGFIDLDTIAATIRSSGADLVAVQELDSVTTRNNKVDQLKVLADILGMYYRFERTIPYGGGAYGIGILSKFPLLETTSYELPNIEGIQTEPRKLLVAKVEVGGEPLYFGCTHFDFKNKEVKLAQARAFLQHLNPFSGNRVIVAGDFNAVPQEESIQLIEGRYRSAGSPDAFTIPVLKPNKKIDYIFYTNSRLKRLQDSVLTTHSYGSDHLPIKAVFQLLP